MGGKSRPAPDYSAMAAATERGIATAERLGNRQMDFAQRQYDEIKPLAERVYNQQLSAQEQQMKQAQAAANAAQSQAAAARRAADLAAAADAEARRAALLAAANRPQGLPSWVLPVAIGGVLIAAVGGYFLFKKKATA